MAWMVQPDHILSFFYLEYCRPRSYVRCPYPITNAFFVQWQNRKRQEGARAWQGILTDTARKDISRYITQYVYERLHKHSNSFSCSAVYTMNVEAWHTSTVCAWYPSKSHGHERCAVQDTISLQPHSPDAEQSFRNRLIRMLAQHQSSIFGQERQQKETMCNQMIHGEVAN